MPHLTTSAQTSWLDSGIGKLFWENGKCIAVERRFPRFVNFPNQDVSKKYTSLEYLITEVDFVVFLQCVDQEVLDPSVKSSEINIGVWSSCVRTRSIFSIIIYGAGLFAYSVPQFCEELRKEQEGHKCAGNWRSELKGQTKLLFPACFHNSKPKQKYCRVCSSTCFGPCDIVALLH